MEARLDELVRPASYAVAEQYRQVGLRARILTLAVVLAIVWRQIPSVTTVAQMLAREPLLWAPPRQVSQQALSQRLRCLPAELFGSLVQTLLPTLQTRAAARRRPLPAVLARAQRAFGAVDASTLEAVFHKVGAVRGREETVWGGKLLAVLDVTSKLPVHLWWDDESAANEKRFLDRLKPVLPPDTLLLLDAGFFSFEWFDWLSSHQGWFITRGRVQMAYQVQQVLAESPTLRDRVIQMGQYRSNPSTQPVRLVEVLVQGAWRRYLTHVLDPSRLTPADVVELYGRRWGIEEAFLLVKRLLGLAYLRSAAANAIQLQLWATWLLYAVLVDLSDAIAEELDQPLDRLSLEMVYRGLYFFVGACARGETPDPIAYLAAQRDLGIVKRLRPGRQRPPLDLPLPPPSGGKSARRATPRWRRVQAACTRPGPIRGLATAHPAADRPRRGRAASGLTRRTARTPPNDGPRPSRGPANGP